MTAYLSGLCCRIWLVAKVAFAVAYVVAMVFVFPYWATLSWLLVGRVATFPKPQYLQDWLGKASNSAGYDLM